MELLFERTMYLDQFITFSKESPPVFITNYDSKTEAAQKIINCNTVIELDHRETFTSCSSTSADVQDNIVIYKNGQRLDSTYSSNDLDNFLQDILSSSSSLFIDITNMGIRLLAILISNLSYIFDNNPPNLPCVYCGYAEPQSYFRRGILNSTNESKRSQFELYNDFAPLSPLPNFASTGSEEEKQLWLVLLGFEGYRANMIHDELTRINDIIALVTIPSLKLGWSNYALTENSHFLRGVGHKIPQIQYITASSPFSAYNYLCQCKRKYSDYRLQISPFSTKANSLGVLLYALNNPECSIVFDNPIERSRKKETHSDIYHVYDITEPLKYKRF